MEEKDFKNTLTPGLPEALHPEIANGVSFAESDHAFKLLSPDPTKTLEDLLPSFTAYVQSKDSENVLAPDDEGTPSPDTLKADVNKPVKTLNEESGAANETDTKASRKIKPKKTKEVKPPLEDDSAALILPKSIEPPSSEIAPLPEDEQDTKKAPTPGKRILKAAKVVQKQQKDKKEKLKKSAVKKAAAKKKPAKKVVSGKTPAKKVPAKKVPTKKTSPVKIVTQTPAVIKAVVKNVSSREKFTLSPFTQWLKDLGGADYVHPYDDDFALSQEKGALNEVISETYADVLAAQGYKERAIEMYLKLIEKYPEKSSFFAAKIEALQ